MKIKIRNMECKKYTAEDVENAVLAIQSGTMTFRQAAKIYNVPRSTLGHKTKMKCKKYTAEDVENAVLAIQKGTMTLDQAAKIYNVPRSTLGRKTKMKCKKYTAEDVENAVLAIQSGTMTFRQATKIYNVPRATLGRKTKAVKDLPKMEIKLEPNSGITCVICLRNDFQVYGQHEIEYEIMLIYKELLNDHVTKLNEIEATEICSECIETLSGIADFRKKCVNSIEILSNLNSKIVEEELLPLITEIKEEIFVTTLPVHVEMKENVTSKRPRKATTMKNTKIVNKRNSKTTNLDVKKVTKEVVEKGEETQDGLQEKNQYCSICCFNHQNIERHVLEVHTKKSLTGPRRCLFCNEVCSNGHEAVKHLATHNEFDQPKKCGKCDMTTISRKELAEHVQQDHFQNQEKIRICDFCDKVFHHNAKYKYHIWTHFGAYKCRYCINSYFDRTDFNDHVKKHEREFAANNYTCHFCGFFTVNKTSITNHLFSHHVEKEILNLAEIFPTKSNKTSGYCYICRITSQKICNHVLEYHARKYEDGTLRCLFCEEICSDGQEMHEHLFMAHRELEGPKKCGQCDVVSTSREELFKHVQHKHYPKRRKIRICEFCDAVYFDPATYKYHMWVHCGAIKCKHCEKSFFNEVEHKIHLKGHVKILDKLFCDFCGYSTHLKFHLVDHIFKKHIGVPNIKCTLCDKMYITKGQLRKHFIKKHTDPTFQCIQCSSLFHSMFHLNRHIRTKHEGEKIKYKRRPDTREFACDQCDMKFYKKQTLQKHQHTHSKTRPYQCHMCSTGYYMNDYLRKHYLREHKVVYSPKEIRKMCGFKRYDDSD